MAKQAIVHWHHGTIGAPCPDNIMMWNAVIFGPGKFVGLFMSIGSFVTDLVWLCSIADTPFEDGTFKLVLQFDETYVCLSYIQLERYRLIWSYALCSLAQQAATGQVRIKDVPSQRLCQWWTMSRHSAESLESHIWCCCYLDQYPVSIAWSQSKFTRQCRSSQFVSRKQKGVCQESAWNCRILLGVDITTLWPFHHTNTSAHPYNPFFITIV